MPGRFDVVAADDPDCTGHLDTQILQLPLLVVGPFNAEYTILKAFANQGKMPRVRGLNLSGLDCVKLAEGYGCMARRIGDPAQLTEALQQAWRTEVPLVLEVPIASAIPPLLV